MSQLVAIAGQIVGVEGITRGEIFASPKKVPACAEAGKMLPDGRSAEQNFLEDTDGKFAAR